MHDSIRAQVYAQIPAAREKGLVLDLILERDSPRWIAEAFEGCAQGVAALVRNAIAETPKGGVSVRVKSAPESESPGSEYREKSCALVIVQGSGAARVLPIIGRRLSVSDPPAAPGEASPNE